MSVALVVALFAFAWLVWAVKRDRQLYFGFARVKVGMTEAQVVSILGEPGRVENCGDFFGPISKEEADGCAHEMLYKSPFAPVVPQYFVVRFSANGHVKNTAAYTSP